FSTLNTAATTAISTLSLHDALPICERQARDRCKNRAQGIGQDKRRLRAHPRDDGGLQIAADGIDVSTGAGEILHDPDERDDGDRDRKSTRLNSSHQIISYAVFCLKK